MKRILLLFMMLLLAFPVLAEEADPNLPPLRDDPVLMHLVEIAHRIDKLAENKRFMADQAYLAEEEEILAVSYGSHERPAKVFHLNGQTLIDALYAGAPADMMLDFTRPELRQALVGELAELLWGRREDRQLGILSILARFKVFAMPGAQGCGVFFLLYEEAAPIMVTWQGDNDCMCLAAYFMPDEALAAVTDAEGLAAWFSAAGMPPVVFEEVPLT